MEIRRRPRFSLEDQAQTQPYSTAEEGQWEPPQPYNDDGLRSVGIHLALLYQQIQFAE